MTPSNKTVQVENNEMVFRQEIVDRIKEFVKEQGWTVVQFAREMQVARNSIYALYDLTTDPQVYYNRLGAKGCDLNWLRTGEKTTGTSPGFLSKKQARALGLPEEIGNYTLEDLRQAFAPDMTIEQVIALAHEIELKVAKEGGYEALLDGKKQPGKKTARK